MGVGGTETAGEMKADWIPEIDDYDSKPSFLMSFLNFDQHIFCKRLTIRCDYSFFAALQYFSICRAIVYDAVFQEFSFYSFVNIVSLFFCFCFLNIFYVISSKFQNHINITS